MGASEKSFCTLAWLAMKKELTSKKQNDSTGGWRSSCTQSLPLLLTERCSAGDETADQTVGTAAGCLHSI
jgi:hypothetical protein